MTIQAQLLAPFVLINFGLAALLNGTHVPIRLLKNGPMPITFLKYPSKAWTSRAVNESHLDLKIGHGGGLAPELRGLKTMATVIF